MAASKAPARRCKAKNAAGKPCRIRPMRGEDYCNAHHPNLPESSRFTGGAKPGAGRPRIERPTEVAVRMIEERLEPLIENHLELALERVYDPNVRRAAGKDLLQYGLGMPTQRTEVTGAGGGPVSIAHLVLTLDDAQNGDTPNG